MSTTNTQDKLLKPLFEDPLKEFHIRSLARKTNLNPNTISTITDKLVKEGLLTKVKDKDTNRVIIKVDAQSRKYKLAKQRYNLEKIYASGVIAFLEDELAYPTVVLFGSYAKAENHKESDIDLFVISPEKKELDLSLFEKKLNASIQLFVHTPKELKSLKKTSPELINNVINGLVLTGFLEIL